MVGQVFRVHGETDSGWLLNSATTAERHRGQERIIPELDRVAPERLAEIRRKHVADQISAIERESATVDQHVAAENILRRARHELPRDLPRAVEPREQVPVVIPGKLEAGNGLDATVSEGLQ